MGMTSGILYRFPTCLKALHDEHPIIDGKLDFHSAREKRRVAY